MSQVASCERIYPSRIKGGDPVVLQIHAVSFQDSSNESLA